MKKVFKFFAVLLSIFYFLGLNIFIIAIIISNVFKGDFYSNILKNIDIDNIKISDFSEDYNSDQSISDYLKEKLNESDIPEEVSEKILQSDKVKEIIGNIAADYLNYKTFGGEVPEISKKDVIDILDEINDENKEISEDQLDEIVDNINQMLKEKGDD